ncbi:uncharacterized protein KGF55_001594 [Candida pseudojiufengensis]|uniref:uncharacterized protein n=1 Tax=Candida pseudojiufengensis TaxID=497109 RepID=UPI0022242324|nr:uncharacterized protein KGF55_001594 [Candida pseudojiufengensis]KAI5965373.1 hypothetical protein KGF55_001594 [Candida pseudojiufengensis]
MIDFESLIEFEESLCIGYLNDHKILLNNLSLKIEHLRSNEEDHIEISLNEEGSEDEEEDDITSIQSNIEIENKDIITELKQTIDLYDITKDEFLTCIDCGNHLNIPILTKPCCISYKEYTQNLLRNKNSLDYKYWLSFIDNPTRTINSLPYLTEFYLKNKLPQNLRSSIWIKLYLLNLNKIPNSINFIFKNFQHSYNLEISNQISKDLKRTFPNLIFFQNQKTIDDLTIVLNLYSNYDLELGYCQGLIFLVGIIYYNLNQSSKLTFFALTNIMEIEKELHEIFTSNKMKSTLNLWFLQFLRILKEVNLEIYEFFKQDFKIMKIFLFQWWLSFLSSHIPYNGSNIINLIMDFCHFQSWKIGIFKLSLGLLIINKELLSNLDFNKDEEIILQFLLNEDKWNSVLKNIDGFFGELLFSWDDNLFLNLPNEFNKFENSLINDDIDNDEIVNKLNPQQRKLPILSSIKAISQIFKQQQPKIYKRERSNTTTSSIISTISTNSSNTSITNNNNSKLSLFSNTFKNFKIDSNNSIYSTQQEIQKDSENLDNEIDLLTIENEKLKNLLRQSYFMINNRNNGIDEFNVKCLSDEIGKVLDV